MPVFSNRPAAVEPADDAGEQSHAAVLNIRLKPEIGVIEASFDVLHLQDKGQAHGDKGEVTEARLVDVEATQVSEQLVITAIGLLHRLWAQRCQHRVRIREQAVHQRDPFVDRLVLVFEVLLQCFIPVQPDVTVGGVARDTQIEVIGAGGIDAGLDVKSGVLQRLLVRCGFAVRHQLPSQGGPAIRWQAAGIGRQSPR